MLFRNLFQRNRTIDENYIYFPIYDKQNYSLRRFLTLFFSTTQSVITLMTSNQMKDVYYLSNALFDCIIWKAVKYCSELVQKQHTLYIIVVPQYRHVVQTAQGASSGETAWFVSSVYLSSSKELCRLRMTQILCRLRWAQVL